MEAVMSNITIIKSLKPDTLGKRFKLDGNGTMKKSVVASVWKGKAKRLNTSTFKELTNLLKGVCQASDIALMAGCFIDAEHGEAVNLVTKDKLTKLLKCDEKDTPGGIQEIDGKKYVARVKLGVEPGSWVLIDADDPEGMPDDWKVLNLQERLELLEPLVTGISKCARVEYRSSSARVVKDGEQPGDASHAWMQISDPGKLETLREHVKVQMQLQELSFPSPRYSKGTEQVIGHEARTVIDLAVWVPGRLVFCSKPHVASENYYVADADIKIVNPDGGVLDVSSLELPSDHDLKQLQNRTGRVLSYSKENGLTVSDTGTLRLDTLIDIKGVSKPFSEVVADLKPGEKVRCETPFRASVSEAALIRIKDDGVPLLHDVGTSTNYYLSAGHETRLRNEDTKDMTSAFSDESVGTELVHGMPPPGSCSAGKIPVSDLLDNPNRIMQRGKNPIANHSNAMTIIRHATEWDGVLAFNELSEDSMLLKPIPGSRTPKSTFKARPV
jgi:hypothetical protein